MQWCIVLKTKAGFAVSYFEVYVLLVLVWFFSLVAFFIMAFVLDVAAVWFHWAFFRALCLKKIMEETLEKKHYSY